jgi:23S rRNA pseudouridine1911/1915/1917 synthase
MADRRRLVVPADLDGERADRVVAVALGVARTVARTMVVEGAVTCAELPVEPSARLAAGTVLDVVAAQTGSGLEAAPVPFAVAYEDDAVIVVDKPTGVVVHPGAGHRHDTLVNGLVGRFPELEDLGEEYRWGLVHRLDRETSGLLVVARSAAAHGFLQQALRERRVGRTYLALAVGELDAATGTIEAPIGRDPAHPTRMAVLASGRPARTHYRRLAVWEGATLLEVTLDTGRTHQIRVHLASIGAPVAGDRAYGRPSSPAVEPGRVWLHAAVLRFPHPSGRPEVEVRSPLPSDLTATLERLGAPVKGAVPDGL